MKTLFAQALMYFGIVFAAGFILGTVRVLLLLPIMSERQAEMLEMPLMLLVVYGAARYIVKRTPDSFTARHYLFIGLAALFMLLAVEFTVVLSLRDMSLSQYLSSRDPVAGMAYLFSLLLFMLAPGLLSCRHH